MRVAIYGRVSTGHQVEHQTIEQQIGRLTDAQLGRRGQFRSQAIKHNPKNMNVNGLVGSRIPMSESALVDVEKSSLWN